ncbi:subtilase family protease [Nitzschia inconspicua]|uniref:Subtilase family protease n=1 Tax=Nitzschia inconspicua TaxID=303405 RepID=A0A9K3LJL8_9STRA|nr:subtilase family protease [Nitzschia inconspicua]
MKLTVASTILLKSCLGQGSTITGTIATISSSQAVTQQYLSHHQSHESTPKNRRSLDNKRILFQQSDRSPQSSMMLASSEKHTPRLRSGASVEKTATNERKGVLRNVTSQIATMGRECMPHKTTNSADIGILGCGVGEYCEESILATTVGGFCVPRDDKNEAEQPFDENQSTPQKSRSQRPFLSLIHKHASRSQTECNPYIDSPSSECESYQQCIPDTASTRGGFCGTLSSNSTNNIWTRLRSLQEEDTDPYYISFFDFIQYACIYDTDPLLCECTTDATTGANIVSCNYKPPCETRPTPCVRDDSTIEYCNQLTVNAQGTGSNDFEFNLCSAYLSPVNMMYCYQVVSTNGLLTCNFEMNDDRCTSCDLDIDSGCIYFDCRNTASGQKGNLCDDSPLGESAFFDLLDCDGSCNICGEGGKVANYDFDLGPILSNVPGCYSPLVCDGELLTCKDLQTNALIGVPIGGDSCSVAPGFDLYSLCCVESTPAPDVTSPPEDSADGAKVPCRALNHDCFSCIENDDCFWCPGDALCFSSPVFKDPVNVFDRENSCNLPEDFTTDTCTETGNFFFDPLYSAQKWIFDMVKVREVWEKGYTGNGIRVRVNDEGIEITHPEFANRIDKEASCPSQLKPISTAYDTGFSHGTAVASILGAAAENNVCGVGIAPNVTISSCYFNTNKEFSELFIFKLESFDISQNSWGRETCVDHDKLRRILQGSKCPFTYEESHVFPCRVCDFSNLLLGQCIQFIEAHCRTYFRQDKLACLEHLDLTLGGNCDFQSLTDEVEASFETGVREGRDGKGVIYVFAAGNSLHLGSDTNFEGFGTNTRMAMAVGAVGKDGVVATYSTQGASLFTSAPGGDISNSVSNIITAGMNGGCTDAGQGTSFAAPVVSGIVALMLEANSNLTYRDVQTIIATTSQPVDDELDHTAGINAANRWHSNYYGFGIVNALAAVEAAENWVTVGNETLVKVRSEMLDRVIPDDETKTITETLEVFALNPFTIESVYVNLKLEHSSRGHLRIKLKSPAGTVSILTPGRRPENTQQVDSAWWRLLSWKFWGESPDGKWEISVVDLKEGDASFEGSCADYEWSFLDRVTCQVLERVQYCEGGRSDPYRIAQSNGEGTVIFSHLYMGLTAEEACCACGGGVEMSELSDTLREWELVIYGERSSDDDIVTTSPTIAQSFPPSHLPSVPVPLPTSAPSLETLSPSEDDDEVPRMEANGDTYFYRKTVLQIKQPSPTEETMLVRNGEGLQADAFSLVSFPFQGGLGLGIDNSTSGDRMLHAEMCLSHVQERVGGNFSTYTLCRVKTSSWNVDDGDGSNLETYQGVKLAGLRMPDDCLGNESDSVKFDVFPNDTLICIDVSDLLMLSSVIMDTRQDPPFIIGNTENMVMFMVDTVMGEEKESGDRFYTSNSEEPPFLRFFDVPTPSPTGFEDSTALPLPTSTPSAPLTSTPTASTVEKTESRRMGLLGLLALLLLCPLLALCIFLRKKTKTGIKEISEEEAANITSFDTTLTIPSEPELSHPMYSQNRPGFVYPDPPFETEVYKDTSRNVHDEDGSNGSSDKDDWESGDGHPTDYDHSMSGSSSSEVHFTNDDTFEDETFESSDEDSNKI